MRPALKVQGRELSAADLAEVKQWIVAHPQWSRWRLSRHLALAWNWRNGAGQLKDMAARTLLLKLQQRGLVELPARRQVPVNRMRCGVHRPQEWESSPIASSLEGLGSLVVKEISSQASARALFADGLRQYHYLGYGGSVGENLQYLIGTEPERPLVLLLFGAAAWKCQERDRFIGWPQESRQRHLGLVANNSRFLILPWVKVPHLGSWALGQVSRRLSEDWQGKYGHCIALVETFVEAGRFVGAAYQAANWRRVGSTTGRTRQDRSRSIQAAVKDIWVYPLRPDFREVLGA